MNKLLEEFYESSNENDVPEFLNNEVSGGEIPTPTEPDEPEGPPSQPETWAIVDTYTTSGTFVAPSDGWYKFELFGASGAGGAGRYDSDEYDEGNRRCEADAAGGGGGGGGTACSAFYLKTGETVTYTIGNSGQTSTCVPNSSIVYDTMQVTSGTNGEGGYTYAQDGTTRAEGGFGRKWWSCYWRKYS